jgi:hypothetical protein
VTWDHAARRLTPAEIDRFDRWGDVCGASPKCQQQATCMLSYSYITGRAGRGSTAHKRACDGHANKFAAKHGITIADAPAVEPRTPGVIAAAAEAWSPGPIDTVTLRRYGSQWQTTLYSRDGTIQTGTCWLDDLPAGGPFGLDVLHHAEEALACQFRLLTTGPWDIKGQAATVAVAPAEHTEAWASARWAVTVYPEEGERPVWCVVALLDARFKPERWPLGNTNMDLARAVRTATTLMDDAWLLGEWVLHDNGTATTTGRRREPAAGTAKESAR